MDAARAIQWSLGVATVGSLVWLVVSIRHTLANPVRYASGHVLPHRHMALVGMLCPILFGAFLSSRLLANPRVAGGYGMCLNNVRQLSTGLQLYTEDADTAYPPADAWRTVSAAYVPASAKNIEQCPASQAEHAYAFNAALGSLPSSSVDDASHTVLVFESGLNRPNAAGGQADLSKELRHGKGRYTLGTCDAAARLVAGEEWKAIVWTPKSSRQAVDFGESTMN